MKVKLIGVLGVALLLAVMPAAACGGGCSAGGASGEAVDQQSLPALEARAVNLRWRLHELSYSDIATTSDRDRTRAELDRVHRLIDTARRERAEARVAEAIRLDRAEVRQMVMLTTIEHAE